ncbi:MAG: chromosome segregation protein SMC [Candidatus Puniceispirillaceae bacterium]
MQFRNLKITGFKSFAESAEVEIEKGLTGIVGPNGCGKSNVVEALRWVMGESNARQMRGTEMDDVIFSGTDQRPARNLAEITLSLDNHDRSAPLTFNHEEDIEITRKVERGKGTSYLVNGKAARAKDVQLLFADTATGSRSAGMVSQGRIGAIVGAKPEDRRSLLEEAANIKGLHQRRHEAELKLKQAETNLERLDDIMLQLAEQAQQLQRQARQAARYRSVADRLRKAEASLLQAKWQDLQSQQTQAAQQKSEIEAALADKTQAVAKATTHRTELAADLPLLREREAEQAAICQQIQLNLRERENEAKRLRDELARLQNQLLEIDRDEAREKALAEDAGEALVNLKDEQTSIKLVRETEGPKLEVALQELTRARDQSAVAEADAAQANAHLSSHLSQKQSNQARLEKMQQRLQAVDAEQGALDLAALKHSVEEAEKAQREAEKTDKQARAALEAAQSEERAATQARDAAYEARKSAEMALTRCVAEIDALAYLLSAEKDEESPVSDLLTITDHMELALAAALSDDLSLPVGQNGQAILADEEGQETAQARDGGYWIEGFKSSQPLDAPDIGSALSQFVKGPDIILQAIRGVSVAASSEDAFAAQASLRPGQALVTAQGGLWRWDGLVRIGQPAQAERLKQRQRLETLQSQLAAYQPDFDQKQDNQTRAEESAASCQQAVTAKQQDVNAATQAQSQTQQQLVQAQLTYQKASERSSLLAEQQAELRDELGNWQAQPDAPETEDELRRAVSETKARAEAARARLIDAQSAEAALKQAVEASGRRLKEIEDQIRNWENRAANTLRRQDELGGRRQAALAEQARLSERPAILAEEQEKLAGQLETATQAREAQSDQLREGERALAEAETALRQAEAAFASQRESLIRSEAQMERLQSDRQNLTSRILEKLEITPLQLPELSGQPMGEISEPLQQLEDRLARLVRERDQIGPVNLRADIEMRELEERKASMESEKDDLLAAIEKLRGAIATLNKEGRSRLLASFNEVNKYFSELFVTLFGGGHAELRLTQSEDPLQAGLEILASPPGKKLQLLTLLSGGEQALTALALIFAAFLTNPAPICVLDEVDAPLDDTNVARFCDLLENIVSRTQTRFLVVTHHRMTMARMDRLFGVTMEQRGISRLVSVDLQTAESMRDETLI